MRMTDHEKHDGLYPVTSGVSTGDPGTSERTVRDDIENSEGLANAHWPSATITLETPTLALLLKQAAMSEMA